MKLGSENSGENTGENTGGSNGVNIRIMLTVEDAGEHVSEEDRAAVDGALGSYRVGQYLDISLLKIVGESQNRIPETTGKIRITIAVPENLKAAEDVQERSLILLFWLRASAALSVYQGFPHVYIAYRSPCRTEARAYWCHESRSRRLWQGGIFSQAHVSVWFLRGNRWNKWLLWRAALLPSALLQAVPNVRCLSGRGQDGREPVCRPRFL